MKILLITRNLHKLQEFQYMMKGLPWVSITSLKELENGLKIPAKSISITEDGKSFIENATAKNGSFLHWYFAASTPVQEAFGQMQFTHLLADDSGLEVDALGGAPGICSARYAAKEGSNENATDADNNAKLLHELRKTNNPNWSAHFRCVLALTPLDVSQDGSELLAQTEILEGICEGKIQSAATGSTGFGYDPLFVPNGYQQSFAELGEKIKNKISHRAKAGQALLAYLTQLSTAV